MVELMIKVKEELIEQIGQNNIERYIREYIEQLDKQMIEKEQSFWNLYRQRSPSIEGDRLFSPHRKDAPLYLQKVQRYESIPQFLFPVQQRRQNL